MNPDDPRLTAYALDELDPAERAELEQLLRDDPAALAEVEETSAFSARLRRELQAEASAPLSEEQRATVLAVVPAGTPARAAVEKANVIVLPWWRRRGPIVLAASIALCAGGVMLLGTRSYLHTKAVVSTSGFADPAALSDRTRFDDFAIMVGDKLAGTTVGRDVAEYAKPAEFNGFLDLSTSSGMVAKHDAVDFLPPEIPQRFGTVTSATPPPTVALNGGKADGYGVTIGGNISRTSPSPDPSGRLFFDQSGAMAGKASERSNGTSESELSKPEARALAQLERAVTPEVVGLATVAAASGAPQPADHPVAIGATRSTVGLSLDTAKRYVGLKDAETRVDGSKPAEADLFAFTTTATIAPSSTEAYDLITDNAFLAARENPLSTFSIDVDTASYANVRRFLNQQSRPPKGAVRIEELLNYFTYDYPQPEGDTPFSATMEVATCPWAPEHRLVRVGLKGREIREEKRPASNLVFLIDVSGSMQPENKLPLLRKSLQLLVDRLSPEDTVSIAVYAGASGCVLEPTRDKREIRAALDRLESGGSTNGAAGIQLAYRLAEQSFIKGGVNRVILATDGDFNVGVTSQSDLMELIERKAKSGVFLTVLGFGMDNLKDSTLEKLADKGNGNYAYIDTLAEGRKVLVEQINGTLVTIAKDVKIQVEFNPAQVSAYRLIGYENRLLAKEDFNNDQKDAGEIGAGHTVTALYEVVPAGKNAPGGPTVDPLKYQTSTAAPAAQSAIPNPQSAISPELLTLKLRYKQPDGDTSKLLEFPLTDRGETWENSSRDFRFAAAVAGYGMLLRESPHKGRATWDTVRELAVEGRGEDRSGYRGEFLTLIDRAKALVR